MKNLAILALVVGAIFWFVKSDSGVDKLMKVDDSMPMVSSSGLNDLHPEPGSDVDADMLAELDVPTVVYLYRDSCDACKPVDKAVNLLLDNRPDVAVKRLNIVYGYGLRLFSYGEDLGSTYTPFIIIYDKKGRRVAADNGNGREQTYDGYHMLFDWANAEARREYERSRG